MTVRWLGGRSRGGYRLARWTWWCSSREEPETEPVHSVLGCKEGEVLKRVQIIAGHRAGVGESGGTFALPRALRPGLGGDLNECMERA
jgi:hypothetical protein